MATPASQFRPNGPTRLDTAVDARPLTQPETQPVTNAEPAESGPTATEPSEPSSISLVEVIEPPAAVEERGEAAAVEFEVRVPPSGELTVRSGVQKVGLHESMAGRTVTVWAGLRSVHVSNDGHVVRTTTSRLTTEDLRHLAMRGARSAEPAPAPSPLRRRDGIPVVTPATAIELDRSVTKDGIVTIAGAPHLVGFAWAGRKVTLRLDGHLMHAIADNALIGTKPCPVPTDRLARPRGARPAATPLPPPPLPAGSLRAQRRVHASGRIMVAKQNIKLGPRHAGKLVTVVIEDTHLRILHGEEELAVRPRRNRDPITRLHVTGAGVRNGQASTENNQSRMS
jgi:hypothetical protein